MTIRTISSCGRPSCASTATSPRPPAPWKKPSLCSIEIDIAVLDYHLGAGKFGTDVAAPSPRTLHPQVPIIILSATLERRFGGVEDMHLLKGYSSIDDLVTALRSFEAKRRGKPVVVDARDFFYSRINMAMGDDVVLEILDGEGTWQYVNDTCARVLEKPRDWFPGRNMFEEMPELAVDWADILSTVAETRETYIDRTFRGVLNLPSKGDRWVWNVLAFPDHSAHARNRRGADGARPRTQIDLCRSLGLPSMDARSQLQPVPVSHLLESTYISRPDL